MIFSASHQGAFYKVITDRADAGVFCDACIAIYVTFSGTQGDPLPGDAPLVEDSWYDPIRRLTNP